MPRINTYTDNTSIEDDDKLLTYDTQGAATKLTAFSRIWTWIQSKIHAITTSTSAWTASNDKVVVDRNGTLSRIDYSILAKAVVETYNGSTLAGTAQSVKAAVDGLNSNIDALKVKVNLAADSSATVNISNSARIVAYSISNNANSQGAFCISTTSAGSVVCTKIGGGEMITAASNASGKLTFTSTAPSGGGILVFMCFTGTVSEAS